MGRGKRYNKEKKINLKKVAAVIVALVVVIMFILILKKMIHTNDEQSKTVVPLGYYAIYENEKWGVINGEGKTVIEPIYDEMIVIPDKAKDVFVVTYQVNYENETYQSKAINSKNKELFTDYEKVEAVINYDKQNDLFYYSNCLKVEKDGKYGLIDLSGKQLMDCLYEDITPIPYLTNSLITIKDGKQGLISNTGAVIINNEYAEIQGITESYEDGYIVKNEQQKAGVIGANKKVLVPVEYDAILDVHSGNLYAAIKEEKTYIVDSATGSTTEISTSEIQSIDGDDIIFSKDGKYGLLTLAGETKLEAKYQELQHTFSNYYIAKLDDKYGIIDSDGNTKLEFQYQSLVYRKDADFFEGSTEGNMNSDLIDRNFQVKLSGIVSEVNLIDGYMKVRMGTEYHYYNFKFEEKKNTELLSSHTLFLAKKDGKYGFVNKDGIVVVNYLYDDATEQNQYGYAAVKKDGKWGAIDSKGNIVVEPTLELTNHPIVDFIGTWHLAEDTNSNYYTK